MKRSYLLLFTLLSTILISCEEVYQILEGTKENEESYEFKRISEEYLQDWDDGIFRDDIYLVSTYGDDNHSIEYYISKSNGNGLHITLNEHSEVTQICSQNYCLNIIYDNSGYLVSWIDTDGTLCGQFFQYSNSNSATKVVTRSTDNGLLQLLDPEHFINISDKLQNIQSIGTLGSDLYNADIHKFFQDLENVGTDYLIGLLPYPLNMTIATLKGILEGMTNSQYERQRNAMYVNCSIKIDEISNDGEGNINVFVTIENANTIPTHLHHLYYDEPEEITQNIVYWGVVGKQSYVPYINYYTEPYYFEEKLDCSISTPQYKMLFFEMPHRGGTYMFRAYLKSLRLKDKNGNINKNHIKYSNIYEYTSLDAFVTEFKQKSHTYNSGTITMECSAKGYIGELKDVIEWGICYIDDNMQRQYFPSDYSHNSNSEPGISSPNEDEIEFTISIDEDDFIDNYKDIKLGIYTKGGFHLGYNGWSEPQTYSLYYNEEERKLIEIYNQSNGNSWTNNRNWCSGRPVIEWYGVNNYLRENFDPYYSEIYSLNLDNNNLQGNIHIEGLKHLNEVELRGNNIESLYLKDCPNLDMGYGFRGLNGITLSSLVIDNCFNDHGQHFLGDHEYGPTNIDKILICNHTDLGRVFFHNVNSKEIKFQNCVFSGQGSSVEDDSRVSTLIFENCVIPSGRADGASYLVLRNTTIEDWVIGAKNSISITNCTIDGFYIGHFSGTNEEYNEMMWLLKNPPKE